MLLSNSFRRNARWTARVPEKGRSELSEKGGLTHNSRDLSMHHLASVDRSFLSSIFPSKVSHNELHNALKPDIVTENTCRHRDPHLDSNYIVFTMIKLHQEAIMYATSLYSDGSLTNAQMPSMINIIELNSISKTWELVENPATWHFSRCLWMLPWLCWHQREMNMNGCRLMLLVARGTEFPRKSPQPVKHCVLIRQWLPAYL